MKMLIILNFILFFLLFIVCFIFSLYVKHQKEEEMLNNQVIENYKKISENYKKMYEQEKQKLEEKIQKITGPNDASDDILNNMLQDAAASSKRNSRKN